MSNQKNRLLLAKDNPTTTAAKKAEYKAELINVQSQPENKQNDIDLIRAVSSEKIRAAAATSSKLSNSVSPKKPKMGGLINT